MKQIENFIKNTGTLKQLSRSDLTEAKQAGFSDIQIAKFLKDGSTEQNVRDYRINKGVIPVVKQIDTLAGEYPAQTNYLYCTYNGKENDVPKGLGGVMTLGSGVYRIGSSVEFDYCGVSAIRALRKRGVRSVMVNYNPETVSTDYDESDALYFEELSEERVRDIFDHEKPTGVIVSVGGQQPNNIAMALHKAGLPILGTSAQDIDNCEDRGKFSAMLDKIGVDQPEWNALTSLDEAFKFCENVGYPVLVRPSYVLSGAAMNVAKSKEELEAFLGEAKEISSEYPVVITKFIEGAQEVECDAVAQDGKLINWAISVHVENAGVHSGDASMILPCELTSKVKARVKHIAEQISQQLNISGPFNTRFLLKNDNLKVIETNLRASRSFPFVSKTIGVDFIETATRIFLGEKLEPEPLCATPIKDRVCVKVPQFSFQRLLESDPILGVEMASTGEVACFGKNYHEGFLKGMISTNGFRLPEKNILISGDVPEDFGISAKRFSDSGYSIFVTPEAQKVLENNNVPITLLENSHGPRSNPKNKEENNVISHIRSKNIHLTINFPKFGEDDNQYDLRRSSADYQVPLITNLQVASTLSECLQMLKQDPNFLEIKAWNEYFPNHTFPTYQ